MAELKEKIKKKLTNKNNSSLRSAASSKKPEIVIRVAGEGKGSRNKNKLPKPQQPIVPKPVPSFVPDVRPLPFLNFVRSLATIPGLRRGEQ